MNVPNPAATGSAGTSFETKVAAACLTLLLTRGAPPFLGAATLRAVHLQAGHLGHGWRTDDLLLEATNARNESVKAALQVKRTFKISASPNEECIPVLRGALTDFRNTGQFDQQHDVVAVVTSSLSARLAKGVRTLLDCARASIDAEDMARRLAIPGYLVKTALGYYHTVVKILEDTEGGPPSEEELWRFFRRFHIADLDLNVQNGITETWLRSLLATMLPDGDASGVDATWNELVSLALADASAAASYTRESLPAGLLQRHGRSTGLSRGVSRLLEDTAIVTNGIRTTIGERTTLQRRELSGSLSQLIETSPLTFVIGPAGSGKSALVKSVFATATECGVGFAFRAGSLAGTHINEVLHRFDLSLASLQTQTAMHGRKVLWVDSLERLMEKPAEQRAAFLDMLGALKVDPAWRLVVTCRDYSAETVRSAFFSAVGLTPSDVEVDDLSDAELDEVAVDFPSLKGPLSDAPLRSLLRNPFFLDMAAKMEWRTSEPLPTSERAFREKVWNEVVRRVGDDLEIGLPNLRGTVLMEVALRRAKALEPFVPADDLDARALGRLVQDSILQSPSAGSNRYAPAHDVFEDWTLMRWLDDMFVQHNRRLGSLLEELESYPALRRAYRRWLTESLDATPDDTDASILALIQDPTVAAHWREDTLVGVLQSRDAQGFIRRNSVALLDNEAQLLRQIIHILRVACRAAIPYRLFGVESDGEIFLPKGNGWGGAAQLLDPALPLFAEADLLLIVGFLEDWTLITKYGIEYPLGAGSIANVAWDWLPRIPWRSPLENGEERLLRIILAIPAVSEVRLSSAVDAALADPHGGRSSEKLLKLIFSHFYCEAVVRDLPNLAFRVAEHLLGLNRTMEEVVADDSGYDLDTVYYAFGLGTRSSMDDYSASAYNGPYLRMLSLHPIRGENFIIRLINRACEAYAHPDNRYRSIEPPNRVTLQLLGGPQEQYANWRLWAAYRGLHVAPGCFESALMALEYWLLEKAKRRETDIERILVQLLRESNNVAITAVVASISTAYPDLAGEAAFALLTCPPILKLDLDRSVLEGGQSALLGGSAINVETGLYVKERKESANLQHRSLSLEYVAVTLQCAEKFQERVWALIDSYKMDLPPESEQDEGTKLWRIQLHRIDTRNFVEAGRTEDGRVLIGTSAPEPDLQALIDERAPRTTELDTALSLLHWGQSAFEGRATSQDWQEQLPIAQAHVASRPAFSEERELAGGGPAYVAAVCIRDHWEELSPVEQEWCAQTVVDAIEADADVTDHFLVVGLNSMEGSRPAAFAVMALFAKPLALTIQARLLPALSRAVLHSVEETVSYAVQGIAQFLWKSNRSLALTCLQALVTQAMEYHAFVEEQRRRPFTEREGEEDDPLARRLRLREFVLNQSAANESQIASLDLSCWPGRSFAQHVFAIAAENPDDSLLRTIMERSASTLPEIWEANENDRGIGGRRGRGEENRFDLSIEHDFVKALCRYVLQLQPDDAAEFFEPVCAAAARFPEKAASIVNWLILNQGDRSPALTMWTLWQRFADDFASDVDAERVAEEYSKEANMLRELFLGGNWDQQRDWEPLHGETQRLSSLFLRLPPMEQAFECYIYYLAKVGTPTLPNALVEVDSKLTEAGSAGMLNETAIFYSEEILTRLIYGGNGQIRTKTSLRDATLRILDALVDAGSSPAYKLRDDFLTPPPSEEPLAE